MITSRSHVALLFATGMFGWPVAMPCLAQETRTSAITATVVDVGTVLGISPLESGSREAGGDLHVSGTVTTRQNGPYQLQVRLTTPFVGRVGGQSPEPHQVLARLADGSYAALGTTAWVTIASGAGSASAVNAVAFLVQWSGGSKSPQIAVTIPVAYRVIPF
jgi:hypothetical protein